MNKFDEAQVYNIVTDLGIDVSYETDNDYVAFCPFHNNNYSPAFCINKQSGLYLCQNSSCAQAGGLRKLIKSLTNYSNLKIEILLYKAKESINVEDAIRKNADDVALPSFEQEKLDILHKNFMNAPVAQDYMFGRGFTLDTLKYFGIGYSKEMNMVSVPMYAANGDPVGLVGRSITDKKFKNSPKLPKKIIPWNIHNAKKTSTVVVTEASFDAMRVHQAGFPGVVGLLGSYFSDYHANSFDRYFTEIILFTDDDDAGNGLAEQIVNKLPYKTIKWASLGTPRYLGKKDASDLSDNQIRNAILNAVPQIVYQNQLRDSA